MSMPAGISSLARASVVLVEALVISIRRLCVLYSTTAVLVFVNSSDDCYDFLSVSGIGQIL